MAKNDEVIGKNKMGPPKIIRCGCKHDHQDTVFGKFMRFFNWSKKGYRCTVCGKIEV